MKGVIPLTIRKDSWNEEQDLILAEAVLKHIRTGDTMTNAFLEASKKLNRTVTACSVRWKTALKQRYEMAINLAKKTTKIQPTSEKEEQVKESEVEKKKTSEKKVEVTKETKLDIPNEQEDLEHAVKVISRHLKEYVKMKKEFSTLQEAHKEIERLQGKVAQLEKENTTLKEEHEEMVKIFDKANQLIS